MDRFWRKCSQLAGPNLFVKNKWNTRECNVAVADIFWVVEKNALRDQYTLARVVSVSMDGI